MGRPSLTHNEVVQNKFGATFNNIVTVWNNNVSNIRLEKHYGTLDTIAIIHTLKSLNNLAQNKINAARKKRAKRL